MTITIKPPEFVKAMMSNVYAEASVGRSTSQARYQKKGVDLQSALGDFQRRPVLDSDESLILLWVTLNHNKTGTKLSERTWARTWANKVRLIS